MRLKHLECVLAEKELQCAFHFVSQTEIAASDGCMLEFNMVSCFAGSLSLDTGIERIAEYAATGRFLSLDPSVASQRFLLGRTQGAPLGGRHLALDPLEKEVCIIHRIGMVPPQR